MKSLHGLVAVLCAKTGEVLDVIARSKYCAKCGCISKIPREFSADGVKLGARPHERDIDHTGSSGSMEVDGTVEAFETSILKHQLRQVFTENVF